jgi:hypothetical protein
MADLGCFKIEIKDSCIRDKHTYLLYIATSFGPIKSSLKFRIISEDKRYYILGDCNERYPITSDVVGSLQKAVLNGGSYSICLDDRPEGTSEWFIATEPDYLSVQQGSAKTVIIYGADGSVRSSVYMQFDKLFHMLLALELCPDE